MNEILVWIYFINAVFLINHEIDSAYWEEWELFKLPGGISGFLIIHFPLLFLILFGFMQVYDYTFMGLIFSLILSLSGLFAFMIHFFFIKKGRKEFNVPISRFILYSILVLSVIQLGITLWLLF
ncbi:MAG: hypothetical protein KKH98_01095 [Spirochaetes bacterium]|nr:hypothetical protein [Spirochaetota bacterium]